MITRHRAGGRRQAMFPIYRTNFMLSCIRTSPSPRSSACGAGTEVALCSLFCKGEPGQGGAAQLWTTLGSSNQPQSQTPEPPRPVRSLVLFLGSETHRSLGRLCGWKGLAMETLQKLCTPSVLPRWSFVFKLPVLVCITGLKSPVLVNISHYVLTDLHIP